MNRYLKLVVHLIGFVSSLFIGHYFLNLKIETGIGLITGMCIGYVFCFLANRSN